jgi:broad specificity phosphatase PhoE
MTMTTAEAMAIMREREPGWRQGMTPAELEEEIKEVAAWDRRMDLHRQYGYRPAYEIPVDHATMKRRAQDAARAKIYRQKKKDKAANVTHLVVI